MRHRDGAAWRQSTSPIIPLLVALLIAACADGSPRKGEQMAADTATGPACDVAAAESVVADFGTRMQRVPLLGPDSVLERELTTAYESLVTPELLRQWLAAPSLAPGRETSSPWPDRIEVDSVIPGGDGSCRVEGAVVYLTSVEEVSGGAAARRPITLQLVQGEDWRIAELDLGAYESPRNGDAPSTPAGSNDLEAPEEVVRRYYEAIDAGDYRGAYALWGEEGGSSGQSYKEFAQRFAATESIEARIGDPGRVEGAAGSRFVEVPVEVHARFAGGEEQRVTATVTLRRAVVDGATEAQRRWHIYRVETEEDR